MGCSYDYKMILYVKFIIYINGVYNFIKEVPHLCL